MTAFRTSAIGVAESALRVAGSLFGGFFANAGNSAYEIQRAIGGPAHDAALAEAVVECKQHFHQCTRCGHWVCPEACWNAEVGLCEECAPNFKEELASAHAQAKAQAVRVQLRDKATATDLLSHVAVNPDAVVRAPEMAPVLARCTSCGALGDGRFCPQCGNERKAACPACGGGIQPDSRFCSHCGHGLA
ncbi:MAG: zinc ribbon domain-containing protein [Polyangiaceae bacterium]|jgi:hypothetical protein